METIRGVLGQMLFRGDEGMKRTEVLSGGEACRLMFCKLMLQKPNFLVLDEPTNHLDLEAVIALDTALQRYEGTVILVTHDEDLIDEVATRIWSVTDAGVEDFQGPLAEFTANRTSRSVTMRLFGPALVAPGLARQGRRRRRYRLYLRGA